LYTAGTADGEAVVLLVKRFEFFFLTRERVVGVAAFSDTATFFVMW
jgi:hypothetical protein